MKNLIIITVIVIFSITRLSAQAPTKSKADLAWEAMPKFDFREFEDDKFQHEKAYELYKRKYLAAGISFWNDFPDDERRIIFFNMMNDFEPGFWNNIDEGAKVVSESTSGFYSVNIDQKLFNEWLNKRQQLKNVILNDPKVPHQDKIFIKITEVALELSRSQNSFYRGEKKSFISRFKTLFESAAINLPEEDSRRLTRCGERLILSLNYYGLNFRDLESIIKSLRNDKYPALRNWTTQKLALLALRNNPFRFSYQTIDGSKIDLEKLRGKVVLLDFWANTCSTCIARMPAIKAIYDKYKNQGFVVISCAYNPEIDKKKILTIHHRVGADWPLMLIGGNSNIAGVSAPNSLGKRIWKQYGFSYVPQLLLLDKQGKLAMYNGLLMNGDFEPIVKQLLDK